MIGDILHISLYTGTPKTPSIPSGFTYNSTGANYVAMIIDVTPPTTQAPAAATTQGATPGGTTAGKSNILVTV